MTSEQETRAKPLPSELADKLREAPEGYGYS